MLGKLIVRVVRRLAMLALLAMTGIAAILIYQYYVASPWTRDGRVRAQVANVAPQVSGQIIELRVVDNQFVHKGDVLYVIEPFDFEVSRTSAEAMVQIKAADLQVKRVQSERRQQLTDLAVSTEEKQVFAGTSAQAEGSLKDAQAKFEQAQVNLKRTQVRSPVNGLVTNLLLRVGDYANTGTTNVSIIDSDSYWIDGFFEETKMANICKGDVAEAQLMGYASPVIGRVQSATRGISVSDATPGTQGLPNVDAVYTWVRLAQRVPVRIQILNVPQGVLLVAGMTATVTIRNHQGGGPALSRLHSFRANVAGIFQRSSPPADCLAPDTSDPQAVATIPPRDRRPDETSPGLTTTEKMPARD